MHCSKYSAYVYSFNSRRHFKPPCHRVETGALTGKVLCPKSHKASNRQSRDLNLGSEVPTPSFSDPFLVTQPREAGLTLGGEVVPSKNQRPLLGMASTSPPSRRPEAPPTGTDGEREGDCPVRLLGEKTAASGRHRRGQAGWRGGGSQQSPPPHSLPPGWLEAGASSPALPRGHSVLSRSVPALFVFLPRGWGWAGLPELGAQTEGRGSRNRNGGGAGPPPPGQLGSVILSVADFSLDRRSQLVAAAGPSF